MHGADVIVHPLRYFRDNLIIIHLTFFTVTSNCLAVQLSVGGIGCVAMQVIKRSTPPFDDPHSGARYHANNNCFSTATNCQSSDRFSAMSTFFLPIYSANVDRYLRRLLQTPKYVY